VTRSLEALEAGMRVLLLVLCMTFAYAVEGAVKVGPNPSAAAFFTTKIQPILAKHCYECHAGAKRYGGLKVDSLETLLAGGHDEGPAIIPGDTQKSSLLRSIRYEGDSDLNMPPKSQLPAAIIADFEHWVAIGAPWPDADASVVTAAPPPPKPPFLGRLHPILVHLPIAALLLAALAEFLVLVRGERWKPATAILVITGTLGTVGAIVSGVNLEGGQDPSMLDRHELLGWLTLVGGLTSCAMLLAMRWVPLRRWPLFAVLFLTALLVSLTGHIGGAMVWGQDWLGF
jgi:uncharacterized membrane protein